MRKTTKPKPKQKRIGDHMYRVSVKPRTRSAENIHEEFTIKNTFPVVVATENKITISGKGGELYTVHPDDVVFHSIAIKSAEESIQAIQEIIRRKNMIRVEVCAPEEGPQPNSNTEEVRFTVNEKGQDMFYVIHPGALSMEILEEVKKGGFGDAEEVETLSSHRDYEISSVKMSLDN